MKTGARFMSPPMGLCTSNRLTLRNNQTRALTYTSGPGEYAVACLID